MCRANDTFVGVLKLAALIKESQYKYMSNIILLLGDQLSTDISALEDFDKNNDIIIMAEVQSEASYVKHHKRKIAFLFSAMRHFAQALQDDGYTVKYQKFDDKNAEPDLEAVLQKHLKDASFERLVLTEPGEWRLMQCFQNWRDQWDITVEIRNDNRFLCSHDMFRDWAGDKKKGLRMEFFYRKMRKKLNLLMEGDDPVGGKWNYDHENRSRLPEDVIPPTRPEFEPDDITQDVLKIVDDHFSSHIGSLDNFDYPVTATDGQAYLDWFIEKALPKFGTYQDAMKEGDALLFHSHLSGLINCGLLSPLACCDAAQKAYHSGHAPLNAVEGFIRQIIGWREFMRGIYWLKMPEYAAENALNAKRDLPDFFWTGETKLNCLHHAVEDTKALGYAHHIQRLMVLGNFCLLAGIDPKQVQEWFLAVYHDAYEWVELPNVSGMALFADGGFLASKPYAASGSYINKMSNYCKNCAYKVQDKTGENACPFNILYWDFMARNQEALRDNHRMGMTYRTWDKMTDEKQTTIQKEAETFLKSL